MTKYEPLNVSEEIRTIRDRLSQILQLIEEDLALISQPELDEYIRQSRLNFDGDPPGCHASHTKRRQESHA